MVNNVSNKKHNKVFYFYLIFKLNLELTSQLLNRNIILNYLDDELYLNSIAFRQSS
jgi:hypothetical protein